LAEFSSFRGGVDRSGEHVFDMIVVGLSPLLTIGQDRNRIYWGMSDTYLIHVTDLEGNRIDSFSINRKPTRYSKRMKRQCFERKLHVRSLRVGRRHASDCEAPHRPAFTMRPKGT